MRRIERQVPRSRGEDREESRELADPSGHADRDTLLRPDPELDELRAISHSGRESIASIEQRERTRTGIQSLKVRFNSVFGYYIEITKSNLSNVPDDYQRKQTLVNAERFTTPELKDFESRILTAHDRCIEIEKRLAEELRQFVLAAAGRIRRAW